MRGGRIPAHYKERNPPMSHYRNATDILPAELLAEVQKHHVGMLWIPKSTVHQRRRAELVGRLLRRGVPVPEIAELADLSERRVQQIRQETLLADGKDAARATA